MKKKIKRPQQPKAFISYSTQDHSFAEKLKNALEEYGLDCFLAHQSLRVSDDWRERLIEEINSRNIFIPILSKNFRTSVWTQQEAGFAMANTQIRIFPITLGNTRIQTTDSKHLFGFLNHFQSQRISKEHFDGIDTFIQTLIEKWPRYLIPVLIERVRKVIGWRKAEAVVLDLLPHFDRFTKKEVDSFIDAAISNSEVWDANDCAKEYLPEFLRIHQHRISRQKFNKLKHQIEHRKPYRQRRKKTAVKK